MKCPNCSHINNDEARYCNNCAFPLTEKKKDWTSILLLAWCGSMLFFTIIWTVAFPLIATWIHAICKLETANTMVQTIHFVLSTAQALTSLVIPYAIPKTGLRIAAFGFIIIAIVWSVIYNINHQLLSY